MISTILKDPKQLLNPFGVSPCKINDMILDVVVSESPEFSWATTQYRTQSGYTATDIRIKNTNRLNIECVYVDKTYGALDLISNGLSGEGYAPETWRDKYRALKELCDAEDIVTVTIGLDVFPRMCIKSVSIIRDEKRAGYLSFSMTLEEIVIIDVDFENVDNSLMPKDEKEGTDESKKEKAKGKKNTDTKKADPKPAPENSYDSDLFTLGYR